MNTKTLLLLSYFASLAITLIGALLKILHEDGADSFLIAGLIISFIFVVRASYEIISSTRITKLEKGLWIGGLICSCGIVSIIYLVAGRDRIIAY